MADSTASPPEGKRASLQARFPRFRASGDTGLTVELGDNVDEATSARVLALRDAIAAAGLPGVIEMVPTYLSLLVHYSPLETRQAALIEAISGLATVLPEGSVAKPSRSWLLPVCFDGAAFAADLPHVAAWAGITPDDVVADLLGVEQVVYMLGFAIGQPYLGDLPNRLAIPRRASPVGQIPAGSVLIATGKTVIYPVQNPTGWHVVGRTPVPLFDLAGGGSVLFQPGDRVRFRAIEPSSFYDIEERVRRRAYDPVREARA